MSLIVTFIINSVFFFQAEDGIRDVAVTGVQTCALPISITVSAPQRIAHTILSTSSSTDEVTAELPILALILVRKLRPMIIGSSSPWLMLLRSEERRVGKEGGSRGAVCHV